jgi:hypothetical protein
MAQPLGSHCEPVLNIDAFRQQRSADARLARRQMRPGVVKGPPEESGGGVAQDVWAPELDWARLVLPGLRWGMFVMLES